MKLQLFVSTAVVLVSAFSGSVSASVSVSLSFILMSDVHDLFCFVLLCCCGCDDANVHVVLINAVQIIVCQGSCHNL